MRLDEVFTFQKSPYDAVALWLWYDDGFALRDQTKAVAVRLSSAKLLFRLA